MKVSTELLEEWDHDKSTPPQPYFMRRGIKQFVISAVPLVVLVSLAVFICLTMWLGFHAALLLVLVPGTFWAYREYWQWANNYVICNPYDGNLRIQERANMWLLIFGSSDDVVSIENVNLDTPTRTLINKIFQVDTLFVGDKCLHNMRNVAHLNAIKEYRTSLEQQQKTLGLLAFEANVAMLAVLERIEKRLENLGSFPAAVVAASEPVAPVEPLAPSEDLGTGAPPDEDENEVESDS